MCRFLSCLNLKKLQLDYQVCLTDCLKLGVNSSVRKFCFACLVLSVLFLCSCLCFSGLNDFSEMWGHTLIRYNSHLSVFNSSHSG